MKYRIIAGFIVLILNKEYNAADEYDMDIVDWDADPKAAEFDCEDSTKWTMNCYTCTCKDGRASCSREKKCRVPPNAEPKLCKPYSQFYLDSSNCQICECNADGIPVCTFDYYKCSQLTGYQFYDTLRQSQTKIKPRFHYGQTLQLSCPTTVIELSVKKCKPTTQWFARCYWCSCSVDGQPRCDKQPSCTPPSTEIPTRCRPGSHPFNYQCSNCYCNDDGYLGHPSGQHLSHPSGQHLSHTGGQHLSHPSGQHLSHTGGQHLRYNYNAIRSQQRTN